MIKNNDDNHILLSEKLFRKKLTTNMHGTIESKHMFIQIKSMYRQ